MREADGTRLQTTGGFRQPFERFSNTELLLSETWSVAEDALGVFVERRVAKPRVHSRAVGSEQRYPFLEIQPRPLGG